MAHCSVYSVRGLHTLVIAVLVLSVSRVLLVNGQVGTCSGSGCRCSSSYQCCLAVQEEASGALVGNATIGFTMTGVFSVDSGPHASLFQIDSSGGITTSRKIDRETEGDDDCFLISISLTVDGMLTPRLFAVDILDINDHEPEFLEQNYTFVVPETLNDQTVDLTCPKYQNSLTAVDNDDGSNGQIKYRIVSGSDYFTVQEDSPCIQNTQELDFETNTSFTVVLEARDSGIPPLSSNVTITFDLQDLNDNAPQFTAPSQGSVSVPVPEDQEVGSLIYHFMAVAADSGTNGFYFDIDTPRSPFPFELNSTTGEMITASALNFERDSQYEFVVQAIGGSTSEPQISSVTVTVMIEDVNEAAEITLAPLLPVPNVIVENQIPTRPILVVNIMDPDSQDGDNRNNSVRILTGTEYFEFEIRQIGNTLVRLVRQFVEIDRETTGDSFNLVLEVTEGNIPVFQTSINATIEVLDVNDNAPRLTETVFYILENDRRSNIARLGDVAFDPDNGPNGTVALYELISVVNQDGVNLTNRFISAQISRTSNLGNGSLVAPPLDREEDGPSLNFTVTLADNGVPQKSAEVSFVVEILDVNDNHPQFSNNTYTFSFAENLPEDSSVGRVYASDADSGENGTIIYTIEDNTNFLIDPLSGEITNLFDFDREMRDNYTILVFAHDNGTVQLAAEPATVVVIISDENDNPPVFVDSQMELSVPSNAEVGTIIGRVEAIDRDKGSNAVVNYRLDPSVLFSVDKTTGEIAVSGSLSTREEVINVSVTAFNPVECVHTLVECVDTLNITISIVIPKENTVVVAGIAAAAVTVILLLLIVAAVTLIVCLRYRSRKGSASITSSGAPLNNESKPKRSILRQVPATNGTKDRRGVQFRPHVQETMYDHKQAVVDDSTVRTVETKTKFDESPLTARIHHNGTIPLEEANGDIANQFYPRQRSPLIIDEEGMVNPRLEFSQSSAMEETGRYNPYDGHSDEESTFADDASNMNTLIPCFRSTLEEHPTNLGSPMRYAPPPHSHPHPQHTSPSHVMGPLPPHSAQYPLQNSGTFSNTLTPLAPDPQHNPRSMSPSPAIPPQPLPYNIGMPPGHHILRPNSRNYPLVMPDAYGRDTPEVQRFQTAYVPSFTSDYDTSTYASSELDEVLDFNPEVEHGVYTLSATEYDEDTQL